MNDTPLPLWVIPAKGEPAHGILIRLAERNGIQASNCVPGLTGLHVAGLRIGDGAEQLAAVLRCEPEAFMVSTPVPDTPGHVSIRGERLNLARDFSRKIRRVCPHCVTTSAHHRFWYDLNFVSTCPEHAVNLVHICSCGRNLSWEDVQIGKCRHCDDGNVTQLPTTFANTDVADMDRWALGRLGVSAPIHVPVLDAMPLTTAFQIVSRVGVLEIGGYRKIWRKTDELELSASEVRAAGFRVLRQGLLDATLDNVYEVFLSSGSEDTPTVHSAYGWFGRWFNVWYQHRKSEKFAKDIAEIVIANASRKFPVYRDKFASIPRENISFNQLQERSGVSRRLLRTVLRAGGMARPNEQGTPQISGSAEDLGRLADSLADSIPLNGVREILGVSLGKVNSLRDASELPIWIRGGQRELNGGQKGLKHSYLVRRKDVEAWVETLIGPVPSCDTLPPDCTTVADVRKTTNMPISNLVKAIRSKKVTVVATLRGRAKFGGAILRIADVKAAA